MNSTIDYMDQMRRTVGTTNADASTQIYVAPGANHCEGGAGPDQVDLLSASDHWVTKKAAPDTLLTRKLNGQGAIPRTLPLCRYPQYPRYTGPASMLAPTEI